MALQPYRDVPIERAKVCWERLVPFVHFGQVHHRAQEIAGFNEMCDFLWKELPRLHDPVYLYRAIRFRGHVYDQYREAGSLDFRQYSSWSRGMKSAVNTQYVNMCGPDTVIVVFTDRFPGQDIVVDVDSLCRRARCKSNHFVYNGGEREFIVRLEKELALDPPTFMQNVYVFDVRNHEVR